MGQAKRRLFEEKPRPSRWRWAAVAAVGTSLLTSAPSLADEPLSLSTSVPAFRVPLESQGRRTIVDPHVQRVSHEPSPSAPLELSGAGSTRTNDPVVSSPKDARVVVHEDSAADNRAWPTIIYMTSDVVVDLPASALADETVVSVVLERIGRTGETYRSAVRSRRAVFRGLAEGAYQVHYLYGDDRYSEDQRRLIVELSRAIPARLMLPMLPNDLESAEPMLPAAFQRDVPDVSPRVDRAWDLMEREAVFSALREFQTILHRGAPRSSAQHAAVLQELLQETTAVDAALVSGARHVGDLVEQVSRELKGCSELAPAMYGCGKALERIAREGLSSFPVSAELIEVHLRLAHAIDPSLVGPMRDLALRFAEAGRLEEAGDCLKRASETAADPETLMLLAQWHSARGEYRDASYVYRGVLRLDETFAPAALELLRLDLTSRTQALYAPQLRQLFVELESLAACESLSAQDRAWARQQWERLRWLIQEGDANLPSFAARRWIPRSWRWVPTEQANRSEALPLTSAVVPAHDRDLPAALIQQTSVKQSSERPIPIPQVVRVTGPDGQSLVPTRSAEAMIPVADPGRAHREEGPAR